MKGCAIFDIYGLDAGVCGGGECCKGDEGLVM